VQRSINDSKEYRRGEKFRDLAETDRKRDDPLRAEGWGLWVEAATLRAEG